MKIGVRNNHLTTIPILSEIMIRTMVLVISRKDLRVTVNGKTSIINSKNGDSHSRTHRKVVAEGKMVTGMVNLPLMMWKLGHQSPGNRIEILGTDKSDRKPPKIRLHRNLPWVETNNSFW